MCLVQLTFCLSYCYKVQLDWKCAWWYPCHTEYTCMCTCGWLFLTIVMLHSGFWLVFFCKVCSYCSTRWCGRPTMFVIRIHVSISAAAWHELTFWPLFVLTASRITQKVKDELSRNLVRFHEIWEIGKLCTTEEFNKFCRWCGTYGGYCEVTSRYDCHHTATGEHFHSNKAAAFTFFFSNCR